MSIEQINGVCAVFVCYFPDRGLLGQALDALRPQVGGIVVVDNDAESEVRCWLKERAAYDGVIHLIPGSNIGVAGGHNLGTQWASANGFSHVLLMDQDSICAPDMVAKLYHTLMRLNGSSRGDVAAIGPQIIDARHGKPYPFIRLRLTGNRIKVTGDYGAPVQTDILISSGTLVPIETLEIVGEMDSSLFIDNVDIDWCFRAASMGFKLYGLPSATMTHHLGDRVITIWFFGRWEIVVHKPLRLYYITRNRIRLYTRATTPRLWIAQDIYRLVAKFVIFSLFVSPRKQNAAMMTSGLIDAFAKSKDTAHR